MIVSDQMATQAILQKALERLQAFYASLLQKKPKAKPVLLQTAAGQEPPPQMSYKKSAGASGVVAMLETIIRESKDVQAKAEKGEQDAQTAYETFVSDSNASIEAAGQEIINKSESLAKANKDKIDAQGDLTDAINELMSLNEVGVGLHQQCDFLIKNYNVRQANRADEIEALQAAKATLSGANL